MSRPSLLRRLFPQVSVDFFGQRHCFPAKFCARHDSFFPHPPTPPPPRHPPSLYPHPRHPNTQHQHVTGLCAAHVVRPRLETDLPLARRGLAFNLCFGDFVEAAYPFMDRCRLCNAGAYLGSALSGALIAVSGAASTAYLPLPLAILACSEPFWLLGAAGAAFFPAFALGLVSRPREKEKTT